MLNSIYKIIVSINIISFEPLTTWMYQLRSALLKGTRYQLKAVIGEIDCHQTVCGRRD